MKTEVHIINEKINEKVTIDCVAVTCEVQEILLYVQSKGSQISGMLNGTYTQLMLSDIFTLKLSMNMYLHIPKIKYMKSKSDYMKSKNAIERSTFFESLSQSS